MHVIVESSRLSYHLTLAMTPTIVCHVPVAQNIPVAEQPMAHCMYIYYKVSSDSVLLATLE